MIGAAQAWKILGIEPTSDRRAVKRAYAARLKAIDPDADIAGFLRLREALATAERIAASRAAGQGEPEARFGGFEATLLTGGTVLIAPELDPPRKPKRRKAKVEDAAEDVPPEAPPPEAPRLEPKADPMVIRRRRFVTILNRRNPGPESADELVAMLETMLADERMEQVDFAEEFEIWLAQQLMQSRPRSDPAIPLAMKRFGWARELGAVRPRYAPAAVARRSEDLRTIAALSQPKHEWHTAFMLLQQPAPAKIDLKDRIRHGVAVGKLLDSLRWHNPDIEWMLDSDHVALWSEALGKGSTSQAELFKSDETSWFGWMMVGLFVLSLLRFAFQAGGSSEPLSAPNVLADPVENPMPGFLPPYKPQSIMPSAGIEPPRTAFRPAAGPVKLPRNIQECVDAGGKLEITPDQYICRRMVTPSRPLPALPGDLSEQVKNFQVPPSGEPNLRSQLFPEPSTPAPPAKSDPSARADEMARKVVECIDAGGKPQYSPGDVGCDRSQPPAKPGS